MTSFITKTLRRTAAEPYADLRSIEYARIIDVVCEGEIEGLVDGDRSIYFDDTPWKDADSVDAGGAVVEGGYNFDDASVEFNEGTQSQGYLKGFVSVESGVGVGVQIKKSGTTPFLITVGSASNNLIENKEGSTVNPTSISLSMGVPALYSQNTKTGTLEGTSLKYEVHLRSNSGSYVKQYVGGTDLRSVSIGQLQTLVTTTVDAVGIYGSLLWYDPGSNNYDDDEDYYFYDEISVTALVEYSPIGAGTWTELATLEISGVDSSNGFSFQTTRGAFNVRDLTAGAYDVRVTKTSAGAGEVYFAHLSEHIPSTTITIRGKATSQYIRTNSVDLTQPGLNIEPWDIKVVRLTDDSTSDTLKNDLYIDSYTKVLDQKLSYPNTAVFGVEFDARQFGTLPARSYELKLLKVKIPSNYNPLTRVYTGIWDGTFKVAWTDNPAWCFYDLVTNKRYGLGNFVPESLVDKAALYTIGQYCDEEVVTGNIDKYGIGRKEPRFTCNLYIQTREEAHKVITSMASIFRGMLYWSNNLLTVIQDSPGAVSSQFTNADVIDGLFNYEGSSQRVRHNVVLVTWNDPANSYKQSVEYVEDSSSIAANGIVETQIVAVGCTSRGQARRVGLWMLYTEQNETEVVTFKTGLEGSQVAPGKIIRTSDQHRAGVRHGGRITASTSTTVTLDSDLVVGSGDTITNVLSDGTLRDATLTPGSYPSGTPITINPPFTMADGWYLGDAVYDSKFFYVGSWESSPQTLALSTDGTKMFILGIANKVVYSYTLSTAWDTSTSVWDGSSSNFSVSAQEPLPTGLTFNSTGTKMYVVGTTNDAIYQYSLTAWDMSTAVYDSVSFDVSLQDTAPQSIAFSTDGTKVFMVGTSTDTVYAYTLSVAWDFSSTVNYDSVSFYTGIDKPTPTPRGLSFSIDGTKMFIADSTEDSVYSYKLNIAWNISTAVPSVNFSVSSQELTVTSVVFSPDGAKMYTVGSNSDTVYRYSTIPVVRDYSIWVASSTSVSPEEWRVVSVTEDSQGIYSISALEYNFSKYVAVEQGLRLEERQVSLNEAATQASVTNITLTEALYVITGTTVASKIIVGWTAPTGAVKYAVTYKRGDENNVTTTTRDPEFEILNTLPGTYYVDVTAYNSIGVASPVVSTNSVILGLTAPPANVTNFEINVIGQTSYLSWTAVSDLDLEYYQIRFAPVTTGASWLSSSILIDKISAGTASISVPSLIGTYLIKAVDTTGNESADATLIVTNISSIDGLNVVETLTEDPSFSGDLGTTPFIDITAENLNSQSIRFNNDGTKMYALTFGATPEAIKQYTLGTPYSVASAIWDGASSSFDISSETTSPVSFEFGSLGTKLYVLDDIGEVVYQYTLSTAYTISTGTYDSVSFTAGTTETTATAITFRPDGIEMFISVWDGATTPYIYSFPMSTAWDISTASSTTVVMDNWGTLNTVSPLLSNEKVSFTTEVSVLKDFVFSADGLTMMIVGHDAKLRTYSLSTAWNILTLTYDGDANWFDVGAVTIFPKAAIFNGDGTELNFLGTTGGVTTVSLGKMTSAYDLSTASFGTALSNAGNALRLTDPNGTATGTYLFANSLDLGGVFTSRITPSFTVTGELTSNTMSSWITLSGVATLSGASSSQYNVIMEIRTTDDNPTGSPTWSAWKTFLIGDYSARAMEFRLTLISLAQNVTPVVSALSVLVDMPDRVYGQEDLLSGAGTYNVAYSPAFKGPAGGPALAISAQGLVTGDYYEITNKTTSGFDIVFKDSAPSDISRKFDYVAKGYGYTISTVYVPDMSTASYDNVSFSTSAQESFATSIAFSQDGTKMYIIGFQNDSVYQYSLSLAWDLSTASYDTVSFSVSGQDGVPTGLTFSEDGTRMYVVGSLSDKIFSYSLSSAWVLSTASYDNISFSVSGQETSPNNIQFNSEGTKMYIIGFQNDSVYQYSLSLAWDLSTASYDTVSFSVSGQETTPRGLTFSVDGTKMYIVGQVTDTVYQYSLSPAWDLSTTSYDNINFDMSAQSGFPAQLVFSTTGSKMYIYTESSATIYQYTVLGS